MEYLILIKKIKMVAFRRLFLVIFGLGFDFFSRWEGLSIYLHWNQAVVLNRFFLFSFFVK